MAEKKKPKKKVASMMAKHIKEEKKDVKSDAKLLKQDMSMAKKMKGKC